MQINQRFRNKHVRQQNNLTIVRIKKCKKNLMTYFISSTVNKYQTAAITTTTNSVVIKNW